jgi:molecular chaperone GrpE
MTQQQNNNNNPDLENQGVAGNEEINQEKNSQNIIEQLSLKISELEQKNNDLSDKLLRSLAEFENARRRSREEIEKASKFAISNFVNELVVIVENFIMASENAPNEEIEKYSAIKNYAIAINLTQKELLKILEKNQVKRIFPLNEQFDHNLHEAISSIENEGEEGIVVQVIQAGYTIANRLIRPALVAVSKAKISS